MNWITPVKKKIVIGKRRGKLYISKEERVERDGQTRGDGGENSLLGLAF